MVDIIICNMLFQSRSRIRYTWFSISHDTFELSLRMLQRLLDVAKSVRSYANLYWNYDDEMLD